MWRTLVVEVVLLSSSLMSCLSWSRVMSKLSGLSTRRKMPWMFLISLILFKQYVYTFPIKHRIDSLFR